jgi:hypothetical protein
MTASYPRAPAAAERLAAAQAMLLDLEQKLGPIALSAAEGELVEKKLAALEGQISAGRREVQRMESAYHSALHLDREEAAAALEHARAEQLADFRTALQAAENEMATVLEAAKTMATSYSRFSELNFLASNSVPASCRLPEMSVGKNGIYGSFGNCEQLILAQLWLSAPARANGVGNFVLPWAKAPSLLTTDRATFAPVIDEYRAATAAIVVNIEMQIQTLNERARATIEKRDAA